MLIQGSLNYTILLIFIFAESISQANIMEDIEEKKSLRRQDYESVRHALPKTKVPRAILHENPSRERHLAMELKRVHIQKNRSARQVLILTTFFLSIALNMPHLCVINIMNVYHNNQVIAIINLFENSKIDF